MNRGRRKDPGNKFSVHAEPVEAGVYFVGNPIKVEYRRRNFGKEKETQ